MEYILVHATTIEELVEEVSKLLGAGWKPLGGVNVATVTNDRKGYTEVVIFQAMTLSVS